MWFLFSSRELVTVKLFKWNVLLSSSFPLCCLSCWSLHKTVITFGSVGDSIPKYDHLSESCWWILSCGTVHLMLYKVLVLTFKFLHQIVKYDHSKESFEQYSVAVLFIRLYKMILLNLQVWPFKPKLLTSTFLWCCLLCYTRWFQLFNLIKSLDEILKCDRSNENY